MPIEKTDLEKTKLQIGYIPLLDCVALLWAKHRGFFSDYGLDVHLVKEASWASLRDRLAFGFLDAAHCLSAMLPAAALGTDQLGIVFKSPLVLSENQAFISLSQKLCFQLDISAQDSAQQSAQKIIHAIQQGENIQFAHVFKHSIHHYCLREWLALADETHAYQINLTALPPPYMVDAMSKHLIDGFCVGEPWNSQAEIEGYSHIIASGQSIIPKVADKVLAMTTEWIQQHPHTSVAMTTAIQQAQDELKTLSESDFKAVWQLLIEYDIIHFPCSAERHVQKFYFIQNIIKNFVGDDGQPKASDFVWLIEKMMKWDQLDIKMSKAQIDVIGQNCIHPHTVR